jgi:putative oxidoreductase
MKTSKLNFYIERVSSFVAAILFLQSVYFKFVAAPGSIFIFTEIGIEPFGRIIIGALELVVAVLLIFRKTSLLGAILGLGFILGAIFTHLFILGINVQNDGGLLFGMAIVVLISCIVTISLQSEKLSEILKNKN